MRLLDDIGMMMPATQHLKASNAQILQTRESAIFTAATGGTTHAMMSLHHAPIGKQRRSASTLAATGITTHVMINRQRAAKSLIIRRIARLLAVIGITTHVMRSLLSVPISITRKSAKLLAVIGMIMPVTASQRRGAKTSRRKKSV